MRHLDLFSGIGGFALAARRVGWQTVAFCEIDPYCQRVLAKHWPGVPIYPDVRELTGDAVGPVDIITGGYPCQPFSVAGKRRGAMDDRHLWPEFARLIRELRPRWAVGENVAGHITMGLDEVLSDLEGLGYAWEAFVIPACAVDAPHRRDRVWIAAHAIGERGREAAVGEPRGGDSAEPRDDGEARAMADANGSGLQERPLDAGMARTADGGDERETFAVCSWWNAEPDVDRVADGVPHRLDRLRALGNAVVPQVVEAIFRAIQEIENVRGERTCSAPRVESGHKNAAGYQRR